MTKKPAVALVTGSARRIGAEIAKTLHAAGMNLILHYHASKHDAEKLCQQLNELRSHSAVMIAADLTAPIKKLNQLIHLAAKAWGQLNVLVNNASSFYPTIVGKVDEAAWEDLFSTNVKAPFFLSQAAQPFLKKSKGCIVNICDIHAQKPMRNYAVYCAAKAGLVGLTQALAKDLSPDIRVNGVSPGAMIWPEGENTLTSQQKKIILSKIPLARHGSPKDIADAVCFLVHANYVTGQICSVDGGRLLG